LNATDYAVEILLVDLTIGYGVLVRISKQHGNQFERRGEDLLELAGGDEEIFLQAPQSHPQKFLSLKKL
jgi:hypothetical protein